VKRGTRLLTLTAWLTTTALLGALTWRVESAHGRLPFDVLFAHWVAGLHSQTLTTLMRGFHEAQGKVVTALIVLGLLVLAWRRQWRDVATLFAMVPLGMLANSGFKLLVGRPRPGPLAAVETHSFSYPSGHTVAITLMCGYLLLRICRGNSRRLWCMLAVAGALGLVATAAFSRVVLGAHHPSDVVASVLFGVSWLGMCLMAEQWLEPSPPPAAA
jgi:undecaprenyl-diphosphatase